MDITVTPTALDGVVIIDTDFFRDERGFFIEVYHRERYREHGIAEEFVQDNHSRSARHVLYPPRRTAISARVKTSR